MDPEEKAALEELQMEQLELKKNIVSSRRKLSMASAVSTDKNHKKEINKIKDE